MKPPPSSPVVRRRRLAAELHRLRGARSGGEVARGIGWSPTKISRAESGRDSIPPEEVAKLIDFYGVSGSLREHLLALAADAVQRGWWEEYGDALAPEYLEYIGLEAEAASVTEWQPDVVPGLLQTEQYARRISTGYQSVITTPPGVIEQMVRVRMTRQERLTRDPVLRLTAVIDEAVLLRRMGDDQLMFDQLEHIAVVSELPNVEVRVLPLKRDLPLITTSFVILSFKPSEIEQSAQLGDVVNVEGLRGQQYVEGESDTYLFSVFFRALAGAALTPDDSQQFLRMTAQRVWRGVA